MNKKSAGKKKWPILLFIAGLVTGCFLFENFHAADAEINFIKNANVIEYGDTTVTSKTLVKDVKGTIVKYPELNVFVCGEHDLMYSVKTNGKITEIHAKVTVKDTQKPEIILKKDRIAIPYNGSFHIMDNIISVSDPVDGPLTYTKATDLPNGYYRVEGSVNTSKPGDQKIRIYAKDKSGNSTSRGFTVNVGKKPVITKTTKDKDKKTS